jgi:rSAM/selenodomain-associated transferase 2
MISVIIPTLNEAASLGATLDRVRQALPGAEVIVADGGSTDGTAGLARARSALVVTGAQGRGRQLTVGAEAAHGQILLFLHADTRLPADAAAVLRRAFADARTRIGTFRLRFDEENWFLSACAWFTRFDSVFTRFGDQGIAVQRDFYAQLGGFRDWPLFEDVDLLCRARRLTRIVSFSACVTTSARRFRRGGRLRQQCRNAWLLGRFLAGTSPHTLAGDYGIEPATPSVP